MEREVVLLTEVIQGANVKWTRYWSTEEKEKIRPKLEKTLKHYPEFQQEVLKVGRTGSARGRRPKDDDIKRSNKYYIQLNPESADTFTISHELQHILTREKAIDVLAMTRSPELIRAEGSFGYIDVPDKVKNNLEEYRQLLHDIAVDVTTTQSGCPVAKEFEKRVRKEVGELNARTQ